ncbi:MAG: DUF2339 domain-containing protein [Byssovorax sp.]
MDREGPRFAAEGDMEEFATFVLVLVLGGGGLLVLLIVGLVSGTSGRARTKEMERELAALRQDLLKLQGRVGFLEGEIDKARSAVGRLWSAVESPRALPTAAKNVDAPAMRIAETAAAVPMRVAIPAPVAAPMPMPVHEPEPEPESARVPVPVAARVAEPVVEAPAPIAASPVANVAAQTIAPAPDTVPIAEAAPEVAAPVVVAPTLPSGVDHSIPEPAGWKAPPAAARPRRELEPAPEQAAREAPRSPFPPPPAPAAAKPRPREQAPAAARARPREPGPAGVPVRIDWERWIGVRGAAALGAGVLVIAGLYFFKYSLDNGLISPSLRVVLGTLTGLGCLAGSERTRRSETPVLANWLAGAGIAILYLAFWAAHAVYGLVGSPVAFGLMALVTVACGLLSVRHESLVIALLGLAGGFSTPLALSSGSDQPLGLFGYLLLLDCALLYLAHKRSWPVLGALSLVGTFFYQAVWVGDRMGPDRLLLGMGIVLVFAGVFGAAMPRAKDDDGAAKIGGLWSVTQAASTLLPFGFGLYFGLRSDVGEHLYALGGMLALLSAGAAWIARARRIAWIGLASAIAGVTVLGTWLARHDTVANAWEVSGIFVFVAAIHHGFLELERYRPRAVADAGPSRAAVVASLGLLLLLIFAAASPASASPYPWLLGWVALAGLTLRHAGFAGREPLHLVTALVVGLGAPIVYATHLDDLGGAGYPRPDRFLAMIIAGAFGFQAIALLREGGATRRWATFGAAAATLLAFATAIPAVTRSDLGPNLYPVASLLIVLSAGAVWIARVRRAGWLVPATALGGLGVIATWLLFHDPGLSAVETAALTSVYAGVFHLFLELEHRSPKPGGAAATSAGAEMASLGGLMILVLGSASSRSLTPWPWLAGWALLAALTLRHASFEGHAKLHLWVGGLLGVGFPLAHAAHATDVGVPPAATWMALVLGAAIVFQIVAHAQKGETRRWASHGAGVLAMVGLLDALVVSPTHGPALVLLGTGLLGFLGLISATRLGRGGWAFAAMLATGLVDTAWALREIDHDPAIAVTALVGQALTVALFVAWPLVARTQLREDRWAFRAAALAGPIWFASLYFGWITAFGKSSIGLLPVLLGVGTLGAGASVRGMWAPESQVRRSALAWLLGVTVAFVSLAVPLQLENEWITTGWALEGVALLVLWKGLDHAGLKHVGVVHLGVVTLRLVANPYVLDYHPRASLPVLNWLAYTYWIPALALLGAGYLLRGLEGPRLRSWELAVNPGRAEVGALSSAAAAVVVLFVWVNLTVFDAFSTTRQLTIAVDRLPARDLTLSLAWALFALVLLAVGMIRKSAALRWTSLVLMIITVGKAFLYDLAKLEDLYRVASLVGLAFSLILISLAYQRFVFGKRSDGDKAPAGAKVVAAADTADSAADASDGEDA